MEQLFREASEYSDCKFSLARFGNMIDSAGSLITYWKNNPQSDIKLTHPEVKRFFFTVADAAQTVIESIERAENGDIMIKKMKAARIYDILEIITGRKKFEIIGLFAGEKLDEELVSPYEAAFCHDAGDYYVVKQGGPPVADPKLFSTANAQMFTRDELKSLLGLA
jgi:FlaA1/EpsC-like NDP-sugar epimerase